MMVAQDANCLSSVLIKLQPNTAPVGPLAATEDQALSLSGFSVSDPDADAQVISVTLSVTSGTLSVSTSVPGGVVPANVSGNNTASVTIWLRKRHSMLRSPMLPA